MIVMIKNNSAMNSTNFLLKVIQNNQVNLNQAVGHQQRTL